MTIDNTADRPIITWTRSKLVRFERAIVTADERHDDEFTFDGHEFVVSYARYLAEYLSQQFSTRKDV